MDVQEQQYRKEIEAIFADRELLEAMRKHFPWEEGERPDPVTYQKRCDEMCKLFLKKEDKNEC